jgi:hypothetical protein
MDKASSFLSLREEFLGKVSLSRRRINGGDDVFVCGECCDFDVRVRFRFDERIKEQLIIKINNKDCCFLCC